MYKLVFFLAYLLSPAIPLVCYLTTAGSGFDTYSLSVGLGIVAFVLLCNQFILASRPAPVVRALGTKGLVSFHQVIPVVILLLALAHKLLKELNGYSDEPLQGRLGSIAWWVFVAVVVATVLLMANTFWQKIKALKNFRAWVQRVTGLDYKKLRVVHNVTILGAAILAVHVFLAGSSDLAYNPVGIGYMGAWLVLALGLYLRYRIRGRPMPRAVKAGQEGGK